MIELENRLILDDGTVLCNDNAIMELLYCGNSIENVMVQPSEDVDLYNKSIKLLDTDYNELFTSVNPCYSNIEWFENWMTPEEYTNIDVQEYCFEKCTSVEEIERIMLEIQMFKDRNMIPVLQHLIYMVDHFRKNKIVWGVGRGSSISSFVLYLIGINRINPLTYNLDISEFLK